MNLRRGFFKAGITLSLAFAGLYYWGITTKTIDPANKYALYEKLDQKELTQGDLIFVTKPGFWGEIAQAFSPKDQRYSHIGLLSKSQDGEWTVINADGNPIDPKGSVREENLKNFLALATRVGVYELNLNKNTLEEVITRARYYVSQGYEFNSQFKLGQEHAFYCTELIWVVIKDITSRDIVPHKRKHWGYEYIGIDDLTINPQTHEKIQIKLP
jgi:Permuted papain-like amidase enzyme, YaeF/YiiX, C92 family